MNIKHSLIALFMLFALTINNPTHANARDSLITNAFGIMQEISDLADEFNLTAEQKNEMRSVLMQYLPSLALKANTMLNNRKNLLASSIGQDEVDETVLLEIAEQQGRLLTGIIISKENMKKAVRSILTEDQQDFVDTLIETVIQYRLNNRT